MSIRTAQSSALAPRHTAVAARINKTASPWVRNPSWLALPTVGNTEQKFVGLHTVWPDSNFLALSATGAYTVDWGDGTTANFASGVTAQYQYAFTDVDIANTNAPVTFQDTGDTVTRTAHGYTNGMTISFDSITTTTGIVAGQIYYVVNATADTFQVSATSGGSALPLTTNGSGIILPYKQVIVTVTPQAGQNLTSLNLNIKHTQTNLQVYASGWLDILVSGPNLTSLQIAGNTSTNNVVHSALEQAQLISSNNIASFSYTFYTCGRLQSIPIWTVRDSVSVDMSFMFANCSMLQSVSLFNTAAVTNMTSMFSQCGSLESVPLFNTAAVTNMSNMFFICRKLKTVPLFNTVAVTNMTSMFHACQGLQTVPLFNTAAVTNMTSMFNQCSALQTVPLFNTAAVTDMNNMFNYCYSLQSVPLFNTAAVTNMNNMFASCSSLQSVPLFNTAAVTNMQFFLRSCDSLQTVPLFNTVSVTNMKEMFFGCQSLQTVPLFNTAAVTTMSNMFFGCPSLQTVPLFNTVSVTTMNSIFSYCYSLQSVPLFNTAAVTDMINMFAGCTSLQTIPALVTTAVTTGNFNGMFFGCSSLTRIQAKNFRFSFSVASCKLSATALNEIYTNLPSVSSQTITVTGNWGTATDTPSIATAKGWTVTG